MKIYTDTASVEQIVDWATDEFNKLNTTNFSLVIADEKVVEERRKLFRYRFKRRYWISILNRLPKWLRFNILHRFILCMGEVVADKFLGDTIAETCNQETDMEDSVIVYPEHFYTYAGKMKERVVPFEILVRDTIRHELRHVEQIKEMRRVNINPSIAFSFEGLMFKYGKGPLERDANEFQSGNEVASIEEVISDLKEQMEKKGWN
jgi:hypothetical protein